MNYFFVSQDESDGISIANIGGVFIVILSGIVLSIITLIFEYFYYRNKPVAGANQTNGKAGTELRPVGASVQPNRGVTAGTNRLQPPGAGAAAVNNFMSSPAEGNVNAGFQYWLFRDLLYCISLWFIELQTVSLMVYVPLNPRRLSFFIGQGTNISIVTDWRRGSKNGAFNRLSHTHLRCRKAFYDTFVCSLM